jgi:hypothetical protein
MGAGVRANKPLEADTKADGSSRVNIEVGKLLSIASD